MAAERPLVLDANILIRAVLGRRVRQIITTHAERASFFAPEVAYEDATTYLPNLLVKRHLDVAATTAALSFLESLRGTVHPVPQDAYEFLRAAALSGSSPETPTTGRSSRQHWRWTARSGPRTRTSSVPGCRLGRRTGWSSTSTKPTGPSDRAAQSSSPQIVRKKFSRDPKSPTMPNDFARTFVQVRATFQSELSESTNSQIPAATFRFNV